MLIRNLNNFLFLVTQMFVTVFSCTDCFGKTCCLHPLFCSIYMIVNIYSWMNACWMSGCWETGLVKLRNISMVEYKMCCDGRSRQRGELWRCRPRVQATVSYRCPYSTTSTSPSSRPSPQSELSLWLPVQSSKAVTSLTSPTTVARGNLLFNAGM